MNKKKQREYEIVRKSGSQRISDMNLGNGTKSKNHLYLIYTTIYRIMLFTKKIAC